MNIDLHPCFNESAHRRFGRVHLPIAPRCNIQCRFCNRQFDCINESRPGVTSAVLSPAQALVYLDAVMEEKPDITVAGIAGPGDPMANPEETLETLAGVRKKHPDMLLCLATNGLNLAPYVDRIAETGVSHVTVTVNAVDPAIGEKLYSWVRFNRRVYGSREGARILMEQQQESIRLLKEKEGIIVKVNFITIPGVNDHHAEAVASGMARMGVDLFNCMPYRPAKGSAFENVREPEAKTIKEIRKRAEAYLPQMRHCTRCRADAVGLIGEKMNERLFHTLKSCSTIPENCRKPAASARPYVAVASMEGVLVNQHLGEAEKLLVYGWQEGGPRLVEARTAPARGLGEKRWLDLAELLADCRTLLVSAIGATPRAFLEEAGVEVIEMEGLIDEAVSAVYSGESLRHMIRREIRACGGGGMGCG
jgi:nitrogen fixation protein NifB